MSLPKKQGLYSPSFEHDACGIGAVVNVHGKRTNAIIDQALTVLNNLDHRGARGNEENTGDGAGILFQIPDRFFRAQAEVNGFSLPPLGEYGVGMIFFCHDEGKRQILKKMVEEEVEKQGQPVLGWRVSPTNGDDLGQMAKVSMPFVEQIFIGKSDDIKEELDFERKLFVIRKNIEKRMLGVDLVGSEYFYIASMSCRTIVYKGMLIPYQMKMFYLDLNDNRLESALALVHSRFSTNTFPSWERAHPYRMTIHNGEINTLRGNVNGMKAREASIKTDAFPTEVETLMPIIDEEGSDSAMFDNCLEFMYLAGRSVSEVLMMMIPEPWEKNPHMKDDKRAFYRYNSCLMEPWDGPAAIVATDGISVCASLDRNGLRPSRYYVTKDGMLVLASEVGVLEIDEANVAVKERLHPGRMLVVDTEKKEIISDEDAKGALIKEYPYQKWLEASEVKLSDLKPSKTTLPDDTEDLRLYQTAFGYTYEDLQKVLEPMVIRGIDPVGAMGNDASLAVLSNQPQMLYNYFKQLFAQVTNPPIDSIREEIVTGSQTWLGAMENLLDHSPEACRRIDCATPVLKNEELAAIRDIDKKGFKQTTISMLFDIERGSVGLKNKLNQIFNQADKAIEAGYNLIILSDRGVSETEGAIPALLASSALHHHLVKNGTRTKASIILETGEPREVHHFCLLLGYGADAVNPYLAFATIKDMVSSGLIAGYDEETALKRYTYATVKGIIKVLSKMGISTIQSYRGAQIFEAVGISQSVIEKYFCGTASRIAGVDLEIITNEATMRHQAAFANLDGKNGPLQAGGLFNWRKEGEYHSINPETIITLQQACWDGNYEKYRDFTKILNDREDYSTIRSLLDFRYADKPLPLDEIESVESICKRFKTGAMSYGSISQEAHETMAIAMNRIGGKSNSGEGGERVERFTPDENGDSRCSAIKQVASGRFGVTSHYLTTAKEIQIKMAQGAKPGEGGQLPGEKVYPWIAKTRKSTPGVGLISPPPHHDIYSIEDLAQLIYDLKCANPAADINVKLVSEVGVGTIAAGVAKGYADVILISGYDGGTGAAPRTSVRHTGLPWELGLSETNQTLIINKLRNRVKLETDGKLLTGKDVAIAALLGAEEFGFATLPLVTMGCIMMRVCNLDTCPVGVATQNVELRKLFKGEPEHVVNFMRFIAENLRETMARIGVRTIDEMVGRTDLLKHKDNINHWKAKMVDVSPLLYQPYSEAATDRYRTAKQKHKIDVTVDRSLLLSLCDTAIKTKQPMEASLDIINRNRTTGTILGSEISKLHGGEGLPEDTISLTFTGSAGQSLGAFVPKGVTIRLIGDANDYLGKGLSGGKIIVHKSDDFSGKADENILIGNVAFYGATSGEAYISGVGGERFCVRNSGAKTVIEGVGAHGCEYMTGGQVIILGETGINFGAGMSGGIAYIYDDKKTFEARMNKSMADLTSDLTDEEKAELKYRLEKHLEYTGSDRAKAILDKFDANLKHFVKVVPRDYKRMLDMIAEGKSKGMDQDEAEMYAFTKNRDDATRLSGN
ncbi:MAG: glutamate synthase large subunit [Eubacteriales bacterium]